MVSPRIALDGVDALIFDLGGVIININYEATIQAFSCLAGHDVSNFYTQAAQVDVFDRYEIGELSSAGFRQQLRELFCIPHVSDQDIDAAWNAMLLDIPAVRVAFLTQLSSSKRIFLLSNTNDIHKLAFDKIFCDTFPAYDRLESLFAKAYFSHLVGKRKPNLGIFEHVIEENGLTPETTLFIDDSIQHVRGAEVAGLKTFHMNWKEGLFLETINWGL